MALTQSDTNLLTSVYGLGKEEASAFTTLCNQILAYSNPTSIPAAFTRALNQLVALGIIGSGERTQISNAVTAYVVTNNADSTLLDIVEFIFRERLPYLNRVQRVAVARALCAEFFESIGTFSVSVTMSADGASV